MENACFLKEEAVHFPDITMHPTLFHRGDKMNPLSPVSWDTTLVRRQLDHPSTTFTQAGGVLRHSNREKVQGCLQSYCREACEPDFACSLPFSCVDHVIRPSSEEADGWGVGIRAEIRGKIISNQEKMKTMRETKWLSTHPTSLRQEATLKVNIPSVSSPTCLGSELLPEFFKVSNWREGNRGCVTSGKTSTLITAWPVLWCSETWVSKCYCSKTGHVGLCVHFDGLVIHFACSSGEAATTKSYCWWTGGQTCPSCHNWAIAADIVIVAVAFCPLDVVSVWFPSAKQMCFIINTVLLRACCTLEAFTDWQVPDLRRFLSVFKRCRTGKHGKQRKGWMQEVEGLQKYDMLV